MESEIKLLLIIIGIFLLILFINLYSRNEVLTKKEKFNSYENFTVEEDIKKTEEIPVVQEAVPIINQDIDKKFVNKNQAKGEYKKVSYAEGDRQVEFEGEEFNEQSSMVKGEFGNEKNYAPFKPSGMKKDDVDIFDSNNYLPQDKNDDWFEVMPEPISVKNRHLINVSRPVGVNTIGSTLKNPSYDIRGTPACPKFVVSPWMQSSIEPDTNIKGLC